MIFIKFPLLLFTSHPTYPELSQRLFGDVEFLYSLQQCVNTKMEVCIYLCMNNLHDSDNETSFYSEVCS